MNGACSETNHAEPINFTERLNHGVTVHVHFISSNFNEIKCRHGEIKKKQIKIKCQNKIT